MGVGYAVETHTMSLAAIDQDITEHELPLADMIQITRKFSSLQYVYVILVLKVYVIHVHMHLYICLMVGKVETKYDFRD
jgi:hypothetical protein